jgi:hypothetical protein
VREHAPLTAASQDVEEDGVEDFSQAVDARSAMPFGARHMRLKVLPLGIGEIGRVSFSHAC